MSQVLALFILFMLSWAKTTWIIFVKLAKIFGFATAFVMTGFAIAILVELIT